MPKSEGVRSGGGARRSKAADSSVLKTTITRKYYVGRAGVCDTPWAHPNVALAVNQAIAMAEESGEPQYVVQIIRVVRPVHPPVRVEVVR